MDNRAMGKGVTAGSAARIAILLHDFAAGGTERIIVRLANHWAAAGRDVTILCGHGAGPARASVDSAVTIVETVPPTPRAPRSRERLARRLLPLLRALDPDVIVGPGNFHLPILAALAAAGITTPIVAKLSNPLERGDLNPFQSALFAWRKRSLVTGIDRLVTMSGALAAEAARALGDPPMAILPEPIITSPAAPDRSPSPFPRLLLAGRLVAQKRAELALATVAAWARPDARLTIVGDGPERPMLQRRARQLGIADRVDFVGHQPGLAECFAAHDLLISTSAFEGFPATLVEAIVAGLPVVATPSSVALPEILAHPSFGQIAVADPRALAAALDEQWRAGPIDEPARLLLAERHDAATCAAAWLDLLDAVVAERR